MATFNDSVPSFLGGVSQQAAAIRPNNVVDDAVNVEALPTEGLTKRYPSEFVASLTDFSGTPVDLTGFRLVSLERDDEDYLIALGSDEFNTGRIYAWDSSGTPVKCEDSFGSITSQADYLDFAESSDIRTQQIADALFVANRKVVVDGAPGADFPQWYLDNPGAGLSVPQGLEEVDYTLTVKTEGMQNAKTLTYSTGGAQNRAATATDFVTFDVPAQATGSWSDADPETRGWFILHDYLLPRDGYRYYPGAGNWDNSAYPRSLGDLKFFYGSAPTGSGSFPDSSGYATEIAGSDFALDPMTGACKYLGSDNAVLTAQHWFVQQVNGNYLTTYGINPNDIVRRFIGLLEDHFDGSSAERPLVTIEGNTFGDLSDKTDADWDPELDTVSNAIRVYFEDGGVDDPIDVWDFTDSQGGDFSEGWTTEIEGISNLPVYWKGGAVVKLNGGTVSEADDEIVEFVVLDGDEFSFARGVWRETSQRGLSDGGFNGNTMPIGVQRTVDGGSFKFVFGIQEWAQRSVGDSQSSKEPSFVGERIMDVFFHENRLGFLAGPGMVLSESGEFYNFWRTTMASLPESDPVDVVLANLDGDTVYHAVPYDSRLFVFSEDGQAAVTSQGPLGPTTIEAPVVSRFRTSPTTRPVVQGRSLFQTYATGDYAQVRQVLPGQYQQDYQDSQATIAVPQYLPREIKSIVKGQSSDALVFVPTSGNRVYVYQYLTSGQEQVMSAWTAWDFAAPVVDCVALQDKLVFFIDRNGVTEMETIRFGLGRGDTESDFEPRLDRRAVPTSATYDVATDTTVFGVPYDFEEGDEIRVSASDGSVLELGTTLPVVSWNPGAREVSVQGDVSAQPMFVGIPFESTVVLSRPYAKQQSPRGGMYHAVNSRQLCRALTVHLSDTGYMRAEVDSLGQGTATDEFLGDVAGRAELTPSTLRTGEFRIPINADVEEFKVTLTNDTAFPSTVVTGSWTIRMNRKKATR